MWAILNDKYILKEIDKLKHKIRINTFNTKELPKFIFICGQQILNDDGTYKSDEELQRDKNKRHYIMNYLKNSKIQIKSKSINNVVCVISEKLYKSSDIIDLLTFEELLAELSDEIILLMESYGTACELGAFSLDDKIMNKLFVINKLNHEKTKSFINDGPIKKIKNNREDQVIHVDDNFSNFKNDYKLMSHLKHLSISDISITPNRNKDCIDLKTLLYELLNIIEIFQPLTRDELFHLYKHFKEFDRYDIQKNNKHKVKNPSQIVDLLLRLELVTKNNGFISMKNNITCYNALFNIDKSYISVVRSIILSRIYKNDPYRMQVI